MTPINLPNGSPTGMYAIPVEKDAYDFCNMGHNNIVYKQSEYCAPTTKPIGWHFEILGSCTAEGADFDVEPYVEAIGYDDLTQTPGAWIFRNYTDDKKGVWNPKESFFSLLAFNEVYFENPLGEKPIRTTPFMGAGNYSENQIYEIADHLRELKAWQSAQSKVVDKVVIIKAKNI